MTKKESSGTFTGSHCFLYTPSEIWNEYKHFEREIVFLNAYIANSLTA